MCLNEIHISAYKPTQTNIYMNYTALCLNFAFLNQQINIYRDKNPIINPIINTVGQGSTRARKGL